MKKLEGIYGILPADLDLDALLQRAEAALRGGVRVLQLRDKKTGYRRRLERARALRALTSSHDARLIINDSLQLAIEAGADGVHLGRGDLDKSLAQLRMEEGARQLIIGITCRADAAFARHVLNEGADYVSFGAIWASGTKPDVPPIGLARLHKARQLFPEATICAIGGITRERLPQVRRAGADLAAVVSSLFESSDIEATARDMVACWTGMTS